MRSNALYYPYITLPDDSWTTRALLYWDKLSSIVPMGYMHRPEQMSDFMRALLTEGLVEPIIPAEHIYQISEFNEVFLNLTEDLLKQNRSHFSKSFKEGYRTRIHAEKLGEIPKFLVDQGLAIEVAWDWYEMETSIATQFMSYLAACLGAIPDINATPVTNKASFARALGPLSQSLVQHPLHKYKARAVILEHLLPTPLKAVDLQKLLRFKLQYGNLLPPLRAKVEAHCTYVSTLTDPENRIEANRAFIMECQCTIAEIEEAMRITLGKVTFGSLIPLFGAGLTLHGTDSNSPIAYTGAAFSLAGAAYHAIASIKENNISKNRPLAYAAHFSRAFGGAGRTIQSTQII
ncbi:MAG: hypothetical protein LBE58_17725 [Comamonas sp.]|jgi:hypothetical protein|nr:hypothetical protein [Comamonas sp.]